MGGKTANPSQDLRAGDILWLVVDIDAGYRLMRHHWEVLELEVSTDKLLAADTVRYEDFEKVLRRKLRRLE